LIIAHWGLFTELGIWGLGFLTHALREELYHREIQKFSCLNLKLETLVLASNMIFR